MSPTGSDTNVDTQAAPFLTIQHAHGAITAGGTIWVMPGTYRYDRTVNLSLAGSANNVTRLWAVPGGARPVIDFSQQARDTSSNRGFTIPGSFWHLKGFEVKNAGDNCINISGSNNTVEWWRQTAAMTRGFDNNFMGNCDMHMFKMYAQTVYAVHAILAMRCTPSWVPAPAPAGTDRRHPGDNRGGS